MSYILDALRRAEAQRARGAVPTLHAPALGVGGGAITGPSPRPWRFGLGLVAVALLLIAAGLGWWLARPVLPVAPPVAPAAGLPPLLVLPAPPVAVAPPVAPTPVPAPAVRPAPPAAVQPAAAPAAVAAQSAPSAMSPPFPENPPAAAAPPQAAPTPLPASAAARAVLQRRELPPELQRELPPLAVSGTVYSSDPSQRLLMVNGELLHEGDRIGPELVVEEIRRKDAVLRYKGQRFSVSP